MTYKVTIKSNPRIISTVVNRPNTINNSADVDISNRQNNSILVWNESTKKHEYITPQKLLDLSDGIDDGAIDYGNY